jgi:hypothetical protein
MILAVVLYVGPLILLCWAWLRVIFRRETDPPIRSWILSLVFLLLMTISYGLTLARLSSEPVGQFFRGWHEKDHALYFAISLLGCGFSWFDRGPIRHQVFTTGVLLCIYYFLLSLLY